MNLSSLTPKLLESSILKMTEEKFFILNLDFSIFIHPKNGVIPPLNGKGSQPIFNPNILISSITKWYGLELFITGALIISGSSPLAKESQINIFKTSSSIGGHILGLNQIPYLISSSRFSGSYEPAKIF